MRSPTNSRFSGLMSRCCKRMLLADVIEGVGGVVQVGQQLVAGNARQSRLAALLEFLLQTRGGQFDDDHQVTVDQFDALQREQERDGELP